jgi:small subunit ribosomal protein S15
MDKGEKIDYTIATMSLSTKEKTKIIKEVSSDEKNTGSADVQIALLSKSIDKLVSHLKKHQQDVHSKRGLITMVIKRKKLLAYLKKISGKRYSAVVKKIGLKK